MAYEYFKALHIIGFVVWFAGLFYLVRLFIYHTQADGYEHDKRNILLWQFNLMEKRLLYIITWPGMLITLTFGIAMLAHNTAILAPWLYLKLGLVLLLIVYHLICGRIYQKLKREDFSITSFRLRLWNEVPTLLLIGIVFLAVFRSTFDFLQGLLGFIAIALLLYAGIRIFKAVRKKAGEEE